VSFTVQPLPSSHCVSFGAGGFEQLPVDGLQTPGTWHWSDAAHVFGLPPVQTPAWQVSVCVHALSSLHGALFGFAGSEQTPVAGLHVPTSWHWSFALQTTASAPVQTPAWQVSLCVQALPSLQVVSFGFGGFEHWPVAGLHVPGSWHWSGAGQTTGFAPVHVPF
jgi:hypothetical protein